MGRLATPMTCGSIAFMPTTGLNLKRSQRSISNPAASMEAGVSRFGWQPPEKRGQSLLMRSWLRAWRASLRAHVLVEAQLASGPDHPAQLREGDRLVRHRAQHERRDAGIE